jgi:hypothetical protein
MITENTKSARPLTKSLTLTVDEEGLWRDSMGAAWKPIDAQVFDRTCLSQRAVEKAIAELQEEKLREAVEREKRRLSMPWWQRIFPWRIQMKIERR